MPAPPRPAAKRRRDAAAIGVAPIRQPLVQSPLVKRCWSSLIANALWLVRWTNPLVKGEIDASSPRRYASTRRPSLRCGTASIC